MKSYKEFIKESIRIKDRGIKHYHVSSVRPYKKKRGYSIFKLVLFDDRELELLIETSGNTGKELIVKIYNSNFKPNEDDFKLFIEKCLFIMNKNLLNYKFTLSKIVFDNQLNDYALINVNLEIDISNLEQIITSTKVMNKKIKPEKDIDKLIYKTFENNNTLEVERSIDNIHDYIYNNYHKIELKNNKFADYWFDDNYGHDNIRFFPIAMAYYTDDQKEETERLFLLFKKFFKDLNIDIIETNIGFKIKWKDIYNKKDNLLDSIRGISRFDL